MRFIISLRDPISRDLSWFNVLYAKLVAAKHPKGKIVVLKSAIDTQSTIGIEHKPTSQTIKVLKNKADIDIVSLGDICTEIKSGTKYIIDSVTCYDRYIDHNLYLFNKCVSDKQRKVSYEEKEKHMKFIENIITGRLRCLIYQKERDIKEIIGAWGNITLAYSQCYDSSILRTGVCNVSRY